jgi:erythritol kinase
MREPAGQDILIGIDAGTSVIKAVAYDRAGCLVAQAGRRNDYVTRPDGAAEQDMTRTWRDTAAVLRALGDAVPGLPQRALALGVTGQGDGTWLMDRTGRPVHHAWLWLDARAAREAREIAASDAYAAIYETTGSGVTVCQARSQMLWMQRHAPEMLSRAATAFHCKDWLYFNLTGIRATDPTEGVFTFGDWRTRDYSDTVIEALGLGGCRALLPPIVDGAHETHPLSAAAAAVTGLTPGLPVSLGYIDIACTALGAGLNDGTAQAGLTILGSTGAHMRFAPDVASVRLAADRTGYILALPGAGYAQLQTNMAATLNIDWVLGLAGDILRSAGVDRTADTLLDGLDDTVLAARPGAALFHPYISAAGERGPFTDPRARASLTGLDTATGWPEILRAVCDGLALAARDCYAAMGDVPGEIRLSGGAARSDAVRTILAAALNRPVRVVAQDEAGAAGAAMIAALAQGVFPDAEAATRAWVQPLLAPPEPPDADRARSYDALFAAYLDTRAALPPVWQAQAAMRERLA